MATPFTGASKTFSSGPSTLGAARGSIVIDTNDLKQVQAFARMVGEDVARSLGKIDASTKKAETGFQRLAGTIGKLRGEIAAVGATAGILSAVGIRTAASMEEARVQLQGMVGSAQAANRVMEQLRKEAAAAGLPFGDMLSVATQLLPTLQGNTRELEKWVPLVRRVAVLNPREGLSGAAFAVREAMSSGGTDLVSLAERFNISRVQLRAALQQTGGDFAAALDMVLTKMGITEQTADRMGKTFNAALRGARDAAMQLLAEGFTPILETLTPILQRTAEWLAQIREANPATARWAANLLGVTTVAAGTLLIFERLVSAVKTLGIVSAVGRLARFAGPVLGRVAGPAAWAAGGAAAGMAAGNVINRATGQPQQDWGDIWRTLRQAVVIVANTMHQVNAMIRTGMASAVAGFLEAVAQLAAAVGAAAMATRLRNSAEGVRTTAAAENERERQQVGGLIGALGLRRPSLSSGRAMPEPSDAPRAAAPGIMAGDVRQAAIDWERAYSRIVRDAANERAEATRQYEQQRTDTIRQYEQTLARDAEDYARQRARAQAQFDRQVADVREEATRREVAWREEHQERIAEIEQDYARTRERRERDHRDRLFDAAARLDAVAVFEEQRRFARETEDADEAHRERLSDEREGYDERLKEARANDERRLGQMREAFDLQRAQEDEDRQIRLERMAEDHAAQLAEMDRAHGERIALINRRMWEEIGELDEAHRARLAELKVHNQAYQDAQTEAQEASLKAWREYWGKWAEIEAAARAAQRPAGVLPSGGYRPEYADGGWVRQTERALVHAGEFVLSRQMLAALGTRGPGSMTTAGNSQSISIEAGAIQVYAAPGMDEGTLAAAVEARLVELLRRVSA